LIIKYWLAGQHGKNFHRYDLLIFYFSSMVSSSRSLALVLALTISAVTTLFLSLFEHGTLTLLLVAFLICFAIAYLSIYVVLEFLIFREINTLHKMMAKLKKRELSLDDKPDFAPMPALRNIHEEIFSFAERKQEEIDHLKKLETFRKEFIADVSHELKTPIFAAQGFLHTLLDGAVNDRAVRMKFLKKAARSLDGLDALVQDLLTLSQIETGQIKMHFESIDIYRLTEEVFEQFDAKHNKKNIDLRIEGAYPPVIVFGDWQRLSQVMTNLVSNAIRHSLDGGEVIVDLQQTKKNVVVSVRDFGEGIPPEHHHRIFERFYRVDKSRTKEKGRGGTGLGLAIVKHILEGHGTKTEVESSPGNGSTFSFKLPRFKNEPDS
jgi:two-component system, OmpR family, phosphate regulon sensor histidine kinase PhoR